MGARRPLHAPPPGSAEPDLALRGREAEEKFLLRAKGASARRRCSHCNSVQLAVLSGFLHAAPGHEKASLLRVKERS